MSIQDEIEKMKTDLIAKSIADKVAEQLKDQWSIIVAELVSTRKRNESLEKAINVLEAKLGTLKNYVDTVQTQARTSVEAQKKALKLLNVTLEELGVSE